MISFTYSISWIILFDSYWLNGACMQRFTFEEVCCNWGNLNLKTWRHVVVTLNSTDNLVVTLDWAPSHAISNWGAELLRGGVCRWKIPFYSSDHVDSPNCVQMLNLEQCVILSSQISLWHIFLAYVHNHQHNHVPLQHRCLIKKCDIKQPEIVIQCGCWP